MDKVLMSEISEQIRGVSYNPTDIFDGPCDDAVGLLRANNIANGKINFDDLVYVHKNRVSEKQMLKKGDILICASSGSKNLVGKAAQIESDCEYSFGAFCKVIRPINIHPTYLGMYFQSDIYRRYISSVSQGANINNIRNEHIDSLNINYYSMNEQKRIAELLCKVNTVIKIRYQQLQKLDKLIESRFIEMFGDPIENPKGWKKELLSKVTSKIGSGATPRGGKESYQSNGITLIRSMNIYDGRFEYKDLAHITEQQASQLDHVAVMKNDVFINITGASIARSCIVPYEVLPARVNQHVAIIRCIAGQLNPVFANKMFISNSFKKQLLSIGESGGATRQAITKQQLETLIVILPSLELQNQFASFVAQVDKLKVDIQKAIGEMQLLINSLMQKYFE